MMEDWIIPRKIPRTPADHKNTIIMSRCISNGYAARSENWFSPNIFNGYAARSENWFSPNIFNDDARILRLGAGWVPYSHMKFQQVEIIM